MLLPFLGKIQILQLILVIVAILNHNCDVFICTVGISSLLEAQVATVRSKHDQIGGIVRRFADVKCDLDKVSYIGIRKRTAD